MALSDTELILQVQKGNNSAFEELVYRYDKSVLSIALKYSGDNDDARDIYQEVFIRMFRGLKNFRFQSEFSTWLFRITINVCLTQNTKKNKNVKLSLSPSEDDETDNPLVQLRGEEKDEPDKITMENETRRNIQNAVERLTPKQKLCFTLKHFEGYKIKEIAAMLDCNEGTVKKYLFDGIRKLRVYLKDYSLSGV